MISAQRGSTVEITQVVYSSKDRLIRMQHRDRFLRLRTNMARGVSTGAVESSDKLMRSVIISDREFINTLATRRREFRADALALWAQRVGDNAVKAATGIAAPSVCEWSVPERRLADLKGFFGSDHQAHPFAANYTSWLTLRETQVTKGLAHFLDRSGGVVAAAFLRALAPERSWPDRLESVHVRSEVPTPRGFIDLVLKSKMDGQPLGAVVEVKLDHHAAFNPFDDYHRHTRDEIFGGMDDQVAYVILGRLPCRHTRNLVAKSRNPWQFVYWSAFLRRLDIALRNVPLDDGLIMFRRQIWEMV